MASLPNSTPPPAGGSPLDSTLTDNTQLSLSTRVACKKSSAPPPILMGGPTTPTAPTSQWRQREKGRTEGLRREASGGKGGGATGGSRPAARHRRPKPPPPPVFACSVAPRCELFTGSGARLGSGDSPPHPEPKGVSAREEEEEDPVVSTMLLTLFSLHVMYSSFQLCMVYDLIYLCFC